MERQSLVGSCATHCGVPVAPMQQKRRSQQLGFGLRPPNPRIDFGDAVVEVLRRDRQTGIEVWAVKDQGRLWTAYHDTYAFCWAQRQWTEQAWTYRHRRYAASTQTTMLIEPGEIHRTVRGGPVEFFLLFVQPAAVQEAFNPHPLHFPEGQTAEVVVRSTLARMCQTIMNNGGSDLEWEESALDFLHTVSQVCAEQAAASHHAGCLHAIRRVREFLHEHYDDSIQLDDLAVVAGLSKYHLSRMFQREIGVPMHRYQTLVRLAKSRELLLGGASVCDTAMQLGFHDQSHFHKAFVRTYGLTPHRFCLDVSDRRIGIMERSMVETHLPVQR